MPIESAYATDFLLVINTNFGRFRDIDVFSSKIACLVHLTLV